jgi:hypothetical protein
MNFAKRALALDEPVDTAFSPPKKQSPGRILNPTKKIVYSY